MYFANKNTLLYEKNKLITNLGGITMMNLNEYLFGGFTVSIFDTEYIRSITLSGGDGEIKNMLNAGREYTNKAQEAFISIVNPETHEEYDDFCDAIFSAIDERTASGDTNAEIKFANPNGQIIYEVYQDDEISQIKFYKR